MANDLETLSAGEIQPYSEGPMLAPLSPSPWANTDVLTNREIDEYQRQKSGPSLFGAAMPAGTSRAQVEAILGQLGGAFMADLSSLGYPAHMVNAAIQFMTANATKAPYQVTRQHNFNLHGHDDWLGIAFGNMVQNLSGSAKAKQGFVTASLQWLAKACKQLSGQQVGTPAQGSAPPTTSSGRPDDLSDAEYNALYDYNEKMKPRTEGILREKWGNAYEANRRMVDEYLQSLSEVEKRHFDRFLNNGLHALNDPTVILGLWGQAVGINNVPRGGAELANEINMMHDAMKNNRKQWLADERMQSRYRELIRIRDGG